VIEPDDARVGSDVDMFAYLHLQPQITRITRI
jgi:hypothetical protein